MKTKKTLERARANLSSNFDDAIWSDKSSIQLDCQRRYFCRKEGEKPTSKPRPKHPTKVQVWAGVSKKGPPESASLREPCMPPVL